MKKVLAVLMALVLMLTAFTGCSGNKETDYNQTALSIGGVDFSIADFNYMFVMNFSSFYNYYGQAMNQTMDLTKSLKDQDNGEGTDWDTYFKDYTVMTLQDLTSLYLHAKEEGVELSDEDKEYIDNIATDLENEAKEYGSDVPTYLNAIYGPGVTYNTIKKMMEMRFLAATYVEQVQNSITVTPEEAREYYDSHKLDFDTVDFRFYYIDYSTSTDAEDSLTKEEAQKRAESFKNIHSEEEFVNLCAEYAATEEEGEFYKTEDGMSLYSDAHYEDLGIDEISQWIFDETRETGDVYVLEEEEYGDILVIMFVGRTSPDYNLRTVRHILFTPEVGDDGIASDEAWAEAEKKAEEALKEYLKDPKEENFANLAKEKSEDSGSKENGGIYENVYKGQMVAPFEEWVFDSERKPADTGIVKTSYGYHVMYYVGEGENNLSVNTIEDVKGAKYNEWINAVSAEHTAEKTEAYELCGDILHVIYNTAMEHMAEMASATDVTPTDETSTDTVN